MAETYVILVDENDIQTGLMEKMDAHRKALLHRAISVFITNTRGGWLIQKRAMDKYHSKGLWTNSCCSHPLPDETALNAANRRLKEELGIQCDLEQLFSFTYREKVDDELTEYEYDHVFHGICDELPCINTNEVSDWKYISFADLSNDITLNPESYTVWFRKIFNKVQMHL
jgi:isopentenyl-diphosphate delta-isomerase